MWCGALGEDRPGSSSMAFAHNYTDDDTSVLSLDWAQLMGLIGVG